MSKRAKPSGRKLTEDDASLVKGMIVRGDRKHDIAAWFGVNQGRIAEVENEDLHPDAEQADNEDLPPPGPYLSGRGSYEAVQALKASHAALIQAAKDVDAALKRLSGAAKLEADD